MTLALNRPLVVSAKALVVAIADTADGRFDAGLAQPLGVFDRQVLRRAAGMVDEPRALGWAAIMDSLFEGIENAAYVGCLARPPADDLAGIGIDDEGDIHKPLPCGDVTEVVVH